MSLASFPPLLSAVFASTIILFLVFDLGFFNRKAHKTSLKSAILQTIFWIAISLGYAVLINYSLGSVSAYEFLTAYMAEKLLSIDNLFVMLLIFEYFAIEERYQPRILLWGILGAVFLRAIFIGLGAAIVSEFHFILYIFGAILIYTGGKLLAEKKGEEKHDLSKSRIYRFASKILPIDPDPHAGRLVWKKGGRYVFTSLFLVLVMIEATDIVFALDSIPAGFSITKNPFILFTANIFAVMGLRAMYFLLEHLSHHLKYLQKGLGVILIFVGGKMFADMFDFHISAPLSLGIVAGIFAICVVASLMARQGNRHDA